MPFFYSDTRKRVSTVSAMTDDGIIYDLTVSSGNFPEGSYILFNDAVLRIASPAQSVPQGMPAGSFFRSPNQSQEFRYLGRDSIGRECFEELSANYTSRLQVGVTQSSGLPYINFDTVNFGPSNFVGFADGKFTLASGVAHTLQAGALSTDRVCTLQWVPTALSGAVPVGSKCCSLGSGLMGGTAVYTTIPSADTTFELGVDDSAATINDAWCLIQSHYTIQTVLPAPIPVDDSGNPEPPPDNTPPFNPSGGSPLPSGEPAMGASYNISGHTVFSISGTSIYVDSVSGNDANPGTLAQPKATIGGAHAAISSGNNAMYLKRGSHFDCSDQTNPNWQKSGVSRKYPFVVASYGDPNLPQPIVEGFGSDRGSAVNYIACVDIDLWFPRFVVNAGDGFLFERCTVKSIDIQGARSGPSTFLTPKTGFFVRFCKILDSGYPFSPMVHGIFMQNVDEVVVEFNVIDRNGWDPNSDRSTSSSVGGPSIHKHNIYSASPNGPNRIFRFNYISRASSHAIHQRTGGICEWNVFVGNPMYQMGYAGDDYLNYYPNGISGYFGNNVAITSDDINIANGDVRGMFCVLENCAHVTCENNIACFNGTSPVNNEVFRLNKSPGSLQTLIIRNNISYQWCDDGGISGIAYFRTGNEASNLQASGNDFENDAGPVNYSNPSGAIQFSTPQFISGMRQSGVIIGSTTDPVVIINAVRQFFTPV